jgi:thiol-disulfide isomerase/thioredoxin
MAPHRVAGVLGLALLALCACRSAPAPLPAGPSPYLGALSLPQVAPAPYGSAALRGQVVLVSFFATWCFPCVAEIPNLIALQRDLGPSGLRIVAVGMDLEGHRVLAPFAEYYGLNYPVLEADDAMREGRSPFGLIRALPTAVLLDRRGALAAAWQGVVGHDEVDAAVRAALRR